MRKRTAFRVLALVNLVAACEWRLVHLGIGVSAVSCAVAGIFLFASFYRRWPRVPGPDATAQEKAEYNLLRIANLVGAEEITGGWELRSGGEVFKVHSGYISCVGKGPTCYHMSGHMMPDAEQKATALLFLHKYPQAWAFWKEHHGVRWSPGILTNSAGDRITACGIG